MLMGDGVISDLVPLRLDLAPIIHPGCLGNDEEECCVQMTLVQFGNHYIQMHRARIVKCQ